MQTLLAAMAEAAVTDWVVVMSSSVAH